MPGQPEVFSRWLGVSICDLGSAYQKDGVFMPAESFTARVFLALGSNTGDRRAFLTAAADALSACEQIRLMRASSVLENPALIVPDQHDFLNQVVEVATSFTPMELLAFLKATERSLGRRTRFRYGPREIDLDILSFGNTVLQSAELVIPHPGLADRAFLRTLLAELGETPETLQPAQERH